MSMSVPYLHVQWEPTNTLICFCFKCDKNCSWDFKSVFKSVFVCLYTFSRPKLSNIDRSSKKCHVISVNSVSVVIKEYQALYADSDWMLCRYVHFSVCSYNTVFAHNYYQFHTFLKIVSPDLFQVDIFIYARVFVLKSWTELYLPSHQQQNASYWYRRKFWYHNLRCTTVARPNSQIAGAEAGIVNSDVATVRTLPSEAHTDCACVW